MPEVLEEDLVERVVVVLAGVHQDVVDRGVEPGDHPREPDELGRVPTIVMTLSISDSCLSGCDRDRPRGRCRGRRGRTARSSRTGSVSSSSPVFVMLWTHIVGMSTTTGCVAGDVEATTSSVNTRRSEIARRALDDDEALDLAQVEVLAAGDARHRRRDEGLPRAAVARTASTKLPAGVRARSRARSGSAAGNRAAR